MKMLIACLAVQAALAGNSFAQPGPPPAVPPSNPAAQAPGNPPAPAGPGQPAIGGLELKAALCQIDGILSPMDGVPVPASEVSLCPPSFSIENVPAYIAAEGKTLNYAALGNALIKYYALRAMAFGPQQCAPLSNLQAVSEKSAKTTLTSGTKNWEFHCRTDYDDIRFARALIMHDPKAAALCAERDSPNASPSRKQHESPELCRQAAAASDLKAFGESACKGNRDCADYIRAITGDGSVCGRSGTGGSEVRTDPALCRGYVAFARAGPAKNAELCGDNGFCLAMAGSAVRAAVDAQREVAVDLGPALLPGAQAKLKALSAVVDPLNEAAAKELDSRAERIAALRLKYDPTTRKAPSVRKGAGNARENQ